MVTARRLSSYHVAARVGYHTISAFVVRRVSVTNVTAAAPAELTWLGVHILVVGWMFSGVGFHTMRKGVDLSWDLYYYPLHL